MTTSQSIAARLAAHYESLYRTHGDNHRGVDWPDRDDALTRYGVMIDLIRPQDLPVTLLDFGCGLGHLYDYILAHPPLGSVIEYAGLDISPVFVGVASERQRDPTFHRLDVLDDDQLCQLPTFDYIVCNGTFTEKLDTLQGKFWPYVREVLCRLWSHARRGLAWNVMSTHVDWQRKDLFHLSLDAAATFVRNELSHHFLLRQDYGLYEYTCYVYKEASR